MLSIFGETLRRGKHLRWRPNFGEKITDYPTQGHNTMLPTTLVFEVKGPHPVLDAAPLNHKYTITSK